VQALTSRKPEQTKWSENTAKRRGSPSQLPFHTFRHGDRCQANGGTVELVGSGEAAGGDDEVDVGNAADEAGWLRLACGSHVEVGGEV
jgi:hypothetical protein